MFYHQLVLAKNGPLGIVWLAAHWDRKLVSGGEDLTLMVFSCPDQEADREDRRHADLREDDQPARADGPPAHGPPAARARPHLLQVSPPLSPPHPPRKVELLYNESSGALVKVKLVRAAGGGGH
eukprot:TRINITY_DN6929_c0_g2_i1.p2 TRINITY_DN6929_c0_g2~~TRINITY_DN6929_c0_g2_i1.p2  ORF type:complete len:124 (-),score=2.69 TRINITY_DN6929_c0_g2_i1:364-735(-)